MAFADAARSASLIVNSTVVESSSQLNYEQTVIQTEAKIRRHEIVSEGREGDVYRVRIRAELEDGKSRADASPAICKGKHAKRLLIGGFPLERPEQLMTWELGGYAYLTAREIAAHLAASSSILVDHDGKIMIHFAQPERVVGDLPPDRQVWGRVRHETEQHRAQYLLVGQFSSFALSANKDQREIVLDVVLLDAFSGACVARTRFAKNVSGNVVVPISVMFGSKEHFGTSLGKAYDDMLRSVARWAEATTSCQPFIARVLKTEGQRVYLDAGAEHGIAIGDTLSAFKTMPLKVVTSSGEVLGMEKRSVGELRVTTVYPRFAIGELAAKESTLQAGDELHGK